MESESKPQCQYESALDPLYVCKEPAQLGKDFCIFHDPDPGKNKEKFKQNLKKQIKGIGKNPKYTFTGYKFPDGWGKWYEILIDNTFKEEVFFQEALFHGSESFSGIKFKDKVIFDEAQFSKGVNFGKAHLLKNAKFHKAKFMGPTLFAFTHFKGKASFSEAIFNKKAFFYHAHFCKGASFLGTLFKGTADFGASRCNGWAHLSGAHFNGKVNFGAARFKKYAEFDAAEFKGETNFGETKFKEGASFSDTLFSGIIAKFKKTKFLNHSNFYSATFHNGEILLHSDLTNVSFRNCSLKNVDLTYAKWREYKRKIWPTNVEVWSRSICKDDYEAENPEEYAKASDVCREIKQAYQRIGNYEKAGEFHFGEKECLRKSNRIGKVNKFLHWVYRIICGYSESASRVVLFALSIIIAWTGFFLSQGFQLMPSAAASKTLPVLRQIGASLYLSVVTFTTLGLGDIHPLGLGSHILVGIESLLGAFTMALFVLVFARKFMR